MTRPLLAALLASLGALATARAQQTIFGTVVDEAGEPVVGGNVALYDGDDLVTGTQTDFDGAYRIPVDPGTYNVEFSYVGYTPRRVDGFRVLVGQENKLDMGFEDDGGIVLEEAIVTAYKVDPMRVDETSQGITLTSEDVKQLGTRDINAIASLSAGATSADEGDAVSIRGGRTDATQYIIDGIRVNGALVPETEIDQIQVVTGGVEAKYGDLSGGVIAITTKGPSSELDGYVEAESSNLTDPYDNSLVGVSLSGPIAKRTTPDGERQTVLGYRFSGRYTYREDDDPPAVDVYHVTDEARARLQRQPVVALPTGGFAPTAAFLADGDVEALDAQPFEEFRRLDLTGKLDARLSDAIDVTLSGTLRDQRDRFTPDAGSRTRASWRLLNAHRNPFDDDRTARGNFRFRHRLDAGGGRDTTSSISNALYTVQVGFERREGLREDVIHGDDFFAYGQVGRFDYEDVAIFDTAFASVDGEGGLDVEHTGYRRTFRGLDTAGSANPVLAAYNFNDEGALAETDFIALNGVTTNLISDGVYNLHTSIGQVYNLYDRFRLDQATLNLQAQFDLRPGRGRRGTHNLQFGVLYEQRTNRRYSLNPRALWTAATNLANTPLQELDSSNVVREFVATVDVPGVGPVSDTVQQFAYAPQGERNPDQRFFYALRESLGVSPLEFVNVDGLAPERLDLSMFSAAELTQSRGANGVNLDYYGYDYLGNELPASTAWDDFFTARDAGGARTFPVAPISPIYAAGYLQDKFTFRNIIVRAGVRIDYFDANTKVLKDPYELYDIQTAADFAYLEGDLRPANIPDEAKVYVVSADNRRVQAYRVGDTYFTADGRQVNRAAEIFTGTQQPAFVDERAFPGAAGEDAGDGVLRGQNFIRSTDFDPDASFEDYEAQVNVMPRLAFSFPISDDANFFAHYDVLVQRPPGNTVATALDYYYFFDDLDGVFDNPNLRPTRTVDYEAGFQQRVSAASALKLSFFVREMRDMVQRRVYLFAAGTANQYTTYDNQDFGTVKGLNLAYDLRRTGPVSLRLAYALQFADGTGSDADSQTGGSLQRGNLRTLYPLSYDERHRISGSLDYRYGRAEGPRLFGEPVLQNTGVNLFGSAVSGRPYTRLRQATRLDGRANEGDINGARLPWNLTLNLRVDRDFTLFADNGRGIHVNAYCRVSNLLDRRNIVAVYPATGQPDDDGFLDSPVGRAALRAQFDREAYLRSYQWRVLNPNFFTLPRRIFLGASVAF